VRRYCRCTALSSRIDTLSVPVTAPPVVLAVSLNGIFAGENRPAKIVVAVPVEILLSGSPVAAMQQRGDGIAPAVLISTVVRAGLDKSIPTRKNGLLRQAGPEDTASADSTSDTGRVNRYQNEQQRQRKQHRHKVSR
jgi:xanthosine utilization system XapX-like protein